MFDRIDHRVVKLGIAVVLVMLLFGGIGMSLRQAGWHEGFMTGLLAGNGENTALVTPYLARHGLVSYHHAGIGFFGFLFRLWFFLILLAIFAKFFGFWHWGGRHHGWGQHGWGQHGWGQQPGGPGAQSPWNQGTTPSSPATESTEPKPSGPISYV